MRWTLTIVRGGGLSTDDIASGAVEAAALVRYAFESCASERKW
jgi:hypothetical protein